MSRRGVVLLEVLVAVVILGIAGISATTYLATTVEAHHRQRAREEELRRAEQLLIATALLTQRDLEQRLGTRYSGEFIVWVDRPEPFLFRIGVSHADRPEVELLATLVHRRSEESGRGEGRRS